MHVNTFVKHCFLFTLVVIGWAGFVPAQAASLAQASVPDVLKAVEARYNRPKTMQMAFEQSLTGGARISQRETGELFLAKPGKILWRYQQPAGKFFLVDGKSVWFYTPNTGRVEHSPVKQSDDMRAPLAFLLGQLDFSKFFDMFRAKPEGDGLRITASPKSKRAPYTEVEFVVSPEYDIRALKVLGQEGSVMEFSFSQVMPNPKLDARMFQFQQPAGSQVVEVEAE